MRNITKALALPLTLALLLTGCGGKGDVVPNEGPPRISGITLPSSAAAPALEEPDAPAVVTYNSGMGISVDHPGDWNVEEESNSFILTSPAEQDSAIVVIDLTYEVSLFLAGHGDMETSVDALISKYADQVAGDSGKENYAYQWNQSENGDIRASAVFQYQSESGNGYAAVVDVMQMGASVYLSVLMAPEDNDRLALASEVYASLNPTVPQDRIDGTLEPANLSDLGFPEAPQGFERFYSPVTGQFFVYPSEWNLVNNVHDDSVILFNDEGALMLTENWTETFFERYNSNGNDLEDCFSGFLDECAGALEQIYGEVPAYHDFQLMATENQELIKATFNYTVAEGTGRCFAELGYREFDGKEYVQATLCLYKIGDSYSIDLFSIIMDSIVIYYPTLS